MPSLHGGTLSARKSEIRDMRDTLRAANITMGDPGSGPLMLLLVAIADVIDRGERDTITIQIKDDVPETVGADARPSIEHEGFDQTQAVVEGWCLMTHSGTGCRGIEKDDEQAVFVTDEDAAQHVIRQAARGSAYHRQALDLVHQDALASVAEQEG